MTGAEVLYAVAAGAAVAGGVAQHQQAQAINRAQKKQGRIERRIAAIENARRARRAIAERRVQQADIQAQAANSGTNMESSSAIRGAVGSLTTQTAANIGAARTRAAASFASQRAGERGAQQAATFGTYANMFNSLGNIATTFGTYKAGTQTAPIIDPTKEP